MRLAEFTLEANPSSFNNVEAGNLRTKDEPRACPSPQDTKAHPTTSDDEQRLAGWVEAGVTRLSVGVQSFDDDVLTSWAGILGSPSRRIRPPRPPGRIRLGRVGLAGRRPRRDALRPGQNACRSPPVGARSCLALYPGKRRGPSVRDRSARKSGRGRHRSRRFRVHGRRVEAEGLRRYEISNFARPGRESLHNLKYWRYQPFLGIGAVGRLAYRKRALDERAAA